MENGQPWFRADAGTKSKGRRARAGLAVAASLAVVLGPFGYAIHRIANSKVGASSESAAGQDIDTSRCALGTLAFTEKLPDASATVEVFTTATLACARVENQIEPREPRFMSVVLEPEEGEVQRDEGQYSRFAGFLAMSSGSCAHVIASADKVGTNGQSTVQFDMCYGVPGGGDSDQAAKLDIDNVRPTTS